jgi:C4-dicarboxylate-specific signal transduction histidine kinase
MKRVVSKNRLILWLLVVFILLLIVFIFLGLNYQRQMIIDANKESLQILANEKAAQVNLFIESQKEKLFILASMNVFKEAVMYPNDTAKIETAKTRINELKNTIPGISILTNKGIVIIGEIDLPGTDYSQHPYFLAKRQDTTSARYYDPLRKADYYAIIGPIYDNTNKSKIIGRIAFDIELDDMGSIMKETIESETNEVYLIDETGLLLSGSKYIGKDNKKGVLIQEVKSDGAKECLEHLEKYQKDGVVEEHKEETIDYLNYMGDEVFGAHAYVPEINGCILAEESSNEITEFSLVNYIKNIIKKEVNNEK